jgi:hypothetical protein
LEDSAALSPLIVDASANPTTASWSTSVTLCYGIPSHLADSSSRAYSRMVASTRWRSTTELSLPAHWRLVQHRRLHRRGEGGDVGGAASASALACTRSRVAHPSCRCPLADAPTAIISSTTVVALLVRGRIVVVNCGDSRVVLVYVDEDKAGTRANVSLLYFFYFINRRNGIITRLCQD